MLVRPVVHDGRLVDLEAEELGIARLVQRHEIDAHIAAELQDASAPVWYVLPHQIHDDLVILLLGVLVRVVGIAPVCRGAVVVCGHNTNVIHHWFGG